MTVRARGDSQRVATRKKAAEERENRVLTLMVQGFNNVEIAAQMDIQPAAVSHIAQRGLERRKVEMAETVEQARTMYLMRLESLFRAYYPWATGTTGTEDDEGVALPPDVRSGELAIKILDRIAAAGGALQAVPLVESTTTVNVMMAPDQDPQYLIGQIKAQLAAASTKHGVIEGELAGADTSLAALTGNDDHDDRPGLPPGEEDQ